MQQVYELLAFEASLKGKLAVSDSALHRLQFPAIVYRLQRDPTLQIIGILQPIQPAKREMGEIVELVPLADGDPA